MKKNVIVAIVTVAAVALVIVADRAGWPKRTASAPAAEAPRSPT